MLRRLLPLLVSLAVAVGVLGACSSGDGSATPDETTTTDFAEGQRKENLDRFATDIEHRESASIAIATDSPVALWATFLREYEQDQPLTVRHDGKGLRVCGVGQVAGGCAALTDIAYDSLNRVESFSYEGQPIKDLVRGEGIGAQYSTGSIVSVSVNQAFLNPLDRQLYVVMHIFWLRELNPDASGCDPTKATYSNGGAVTASRGGGLAGGIDYAVMTVAFADASLGGDVEVSCYRNDGSNERFTLPIAS